MNWKIISGPLAVQSLRSSIGYSQKGDLQAQNMSKGIAAIFYIIFTVINIAYRWRVEIIKQFCDFIHGGLVSSGALAY